MCLDDELEYLLDAPPPPTRPETASTEPEPEAIETRTCTSCHEEKPRSEFWGRRSQCKPCGLEYDRRWREANPDKVKRYHRDHNARRKADAQEAAEARLEEARKHISRGAMPLDYEDFIAANEQWREGRAVHK